MDADVVLLGEVHDNEGHFRARRQLIESLIETRDAGSKGAKRGALVLEHIRGDQQGEVDAFLAERAKAPASDGPSAHQLMQRLKIVGPDAWPQQAALERLIDAALEQRLTLVAGDAPRDLVRAAARGGFGAIPETERLRLGLGTPLEAPLEQALIETLKAGHCDMLPERALGGMTLAQRLRDAHLAATLAAAVKRHGKAFLIAGNEHVRRDRGVPWHLARHHPHLKIATVMLVEAPDSARHFDPLIPRDPERKMVADAILFTAAPSRPDPCEAMRRHMERRPKGKGATDE